MLAKFDSLYYLFKAFPDEQSCIDHMRDRSVGRTASSVRTVEAIAHLSLQ